MYVCTYVQIDILAAISNCETLVEGSLFSLHTRALAVEAIGANSAEKSVILLMSIMHLGQEATPHSVNNES